MRRVALILSLSGLVILLAACATRSPPYGHEAAVPHPMYKVGKPYRSTASGTIRPRISTYDETGIASWYGEDFHGKYTANGEVFDLNATDGRASHPADAEHRPGDQSRKRALARAARQ